MYIHYTLIYMFFLLKKSIEVPRKLYLTFEKHINTPLYVLIDSIQVVGYTVWPKTANQGDSCVIKLRMSAPHKSENTRYQVKNRSLCHPLCLWCQHTLTGTFTYLSLKNMTSCCNSVTASKDRCGSHLSGVLGGGLFENSEANFGLIPVGNRNKQFRYILIRTNKTLVLKMYPAFFSYLIKCSWCNYQKSIVINTS